MSSPSSHPRPAAGPRPVRRPTIAHASGIYLYDDTGRRYLDASSGAIVANIGHGVPEILAAIANQAACVTYVHRSQFDTAPTRQLAARLTALAPGDLAPVMFLNSGSEANDAAIRCAVRYWHTRGETAKTKILGRRTSYHGMTLAALGASGHPDRRDGLQAILPPAPTVPAPYCYRCPLGLRPESCGIACVSDWELAITRAGAETVAAVIAEPVIGAAGGAIPSPPGYWRRLREICDRHNVLLIADEIMTGGGRTGRFFASNRENVVPDLVTLGKGISAGYTPIAVLHARAEITDTLAATSGGIGFSHTYSANPLSAAIALAVLDYIDHNDLITAARDRGRDLKRGLRQLATRHPTIGQVRGEGLLLGIELVAGQATRQPFPAETRAAQQLTATALAHGLVVYTAGTQDCPDAVLIAPPLTITTAQITELLALLDTSLEQAERQLTPSSLPHTSAPIQPLGN